MIELSHVTRRYQVDGGAEIIALNDVSLNIAKGEFLSIMGPSGSGKTTLLGILGLLDIPSSGDYRIEGTSIHSIKESALARIRNKHFGYVFQEYNLLQDRTVQGNIEVPLKIAGVASAKRKSRVDEIIERMGLSGRREHYPRMLSGGEQQRVAIGRALANEPDFIFADEPTGNLPQETGREIMELFKALNEGGTSIIVVTHDPAVAAYGSRLIKFRDGAMVA